VALLRAHDETEAARALEIPLLLLHAEGDEVVPVELSRALHEAAPASKLVVVPGGHHRSIQHDAELQGESVRFLARALR
jgi:pimeloyl-ACP methyl ester carboxylesterase